jgi:RES domain-containing protein
VEELRELGDRWLKRGKTVILRVPSAVVPSESNYLLNPAHDDFRRISKGKPNIATLETRLKIT